MRKRFLFHKLALSALFLGTALSVSSQNLPMPKQERLLNGLKLLMWSDPAANKVTVKIRIHSGTAFDPQGKEGVMSLLAESFFPTEAARNFYREDLGGSLQVTANYDYIQVSASSRPDAMVTLLESVSTAVANPTIDKDTTLALRNARLTKLKELQSDAAYLADAAAAKQLFGNFPYGRPQLGTPESVARIEFADLIDAKQRFLTSDNATVSVTGKIDPIVVYRAARRFLGSWIKSDKLVPSTFEQPSEPDVKTVRVVFLGETAPRVRFETRGVARSEKDYAAAEILGAVLESRLKENVDAEKAPTVFVHNESHVLPGSLAAGFEAANEGDAPANLVTLLLSKPIGLGEFTAARNVAAENRRKIAIDEFWLDADTYHISSVADEQKSFDTASLADVQALASRLAKNPVVSVLVVGNKTAPASN